MSAIRLLFDNEYEPKGWRDAKVQFRARHEAVALEARWTLTSFGMRIITMRPALLHWGDRVDQHSVFFRV